MRDTQPRVWGIHAKLWSDADAFFLRKGNVALGWPEMGDLSKLASSREAFKTRVAESYPGVRPGVIPNNAGQLFRFTHEMEVGDLIVYRSRADKLVHIGRVDGPYKYEPQLAPAYPHTRSVKWLKGLTPTAFSQGALYEIGSAMSFFQVKSYAAEFRNAVEGKAPPSESPGDEPVEHGAEEIEQNTRDFVLKRLAQELKGHPLSYFVAHLLNQMGYKTRVSPEGPDGGVDILAHRDELGLEPPIVKVQVKGSEGTIGDPVVSSLYGKVGEREYGMVVTLGTFSSQARSFERGKANLRLIDGEELVDLVLANYDRFDSRYKGLIPLKRVYVPESLEMVES